LLTFCDAEKSASEKKRVKTRKQEIIVHFFDFNEINIKKTIDIEIK